MKIALFTYHFWNNTSAESIVTRKTVRALQEYGHRLTVYTWSSRDINRLDNESVKCLSEEVGYSKIRKIQNTIKSFPLSLSHWPPDPYILNAIDVVSYDHQKEPFDLIYSRSNKVTSHIAALGFRNRNPLPWIAGFNDPYPESLYPSSYDNSIKKRKGRCKLIDNWLIKEIYTKPDALIFPSARLQAHLLRNLPFIDQNKCHIVPHIGADIGPLTHTPDIDSLIFSHVGKLDMARNPEHFLKAWKVFSESTELKVEFRQIGRVDHDLNQTPNDRTIKVIPPIPYEQSISEINKSDVALLIEAPMKEGIFLPSKFADYISMGKPVLCLSPNKGTINDYISNNGGGIVVDPQDEQGILNALKLLSDPKERARYIPNAQFRNLFSPSEIGKQLNTIFAQVMSNA